MGTKEGKKKTYNCPSFIVIKYPNESKFWEVFSSGLPWQQALKGVNARTPGAQATIALGMMLPTGQLDLDNLHLPLSG